jgi:hypothetical protein
MNSGRSQRTPGKAFIELSQLFASPILEADGCIVVSGGADVLRHAVSFPGDPVGFEAFVNHVHLDDITDSTAGRPARRDLIRIGENVIRVWSDRLRRILRGREVLFYLGGLEGVSLRLHVVRDQQANWLNLDDREFMHKEKMRVFLLTSEGLTEVF